AADFIGRIEANVGIDSDGLHWQLGFTPTVSVAQLARIAGPAFVEYARRTKEVEAIINLESLALAAVSRHHEQGTYPVAVDVVCSGGARPDGSRVEPSETSWDQAPWADLRFAVAHAHIYRFCYQTDDTGTAYAAWAEAVLGAGDAV